MTNDEMRRNWTSGADGWVRNQAVFDALFAPLTAALLQSATSRPARRALDIGCGTGTLLAALSDTMDAVGIDISDAMVEAARAREPDATVLVADAESAAILQLAPGDPFDLLISRFGVMFFDDPTTAFANLRAASANQARLVFACWRTRGENPNFTLGTDVLVAAMEPQPAPSPTAPGPMAFADPERLRMILHGAGWTSIEISPFDFTCQHGDPAGPIPVDPAEPVVPVDPVEERLAIILATSTGRLAREQLEPKLGTDGWARLLDDVRAELRSHVSDGVIRYPAATWLVTATNG